MIGENVFSIKIGGQAGQGIKAAGLMLTKVASRSGYNIHTYTEFPSLIRGGHNVMQILVSTNEISAPLKKTDLLIALNQDTVNKHAAEMTLKGGVLFDADKRIDTTMITSGINLYPVPLARLANTAGGEILINTVALGATLALLKGELSILKDLIRYEFADKGDKVISINYQACESGYNYAKQQFADKLLNIFQIIPNQKPKMIVNGNEAVALGAIAGGVQFAAIYPMSPISNILHVLAANQRQYGYIYKQPEDEISAINMAVGASFAGARSMTATSGGGFSLMTEGYGLAAMTETPLVIIYGMRPGPATGLPTWSGQGDLQFVLHAHQGDFPRIVLAAGDSKEAFELTMLAFNLADKYQTPVIVLIDKNICEDDCSYPLFDISSYQLSRGKLTGTPDADYSRYAVTDDGISMRTFPGNGNFFIGNSYEHDEKGFDSEDTDVITAQQDKRMKKLQTLAQTDMSSPQLIGPQNADITIVSWGSNKGSIIHAIKEFPNVNYLHLSWMSPFPTTAVKNILANAKHVIDIECNSTAQLAVLIKEQTGFEITDKLLKYDGRPIYPEEIRDKLNTNIEIRNPKQYQKS
jgi:2-oxoglutarate/2-oxoacid ferredoxin oxidoreductase subunit alpha